jgi:electron transfer flavoprotein alpha subunit
MTHEVLAFCYASEDELPRASLEVLAAGQELQAELGEEGTIHALLIGPGAGQHAETIIQHGADHVLLADHERFEEDQSYLILDAVQAAVDQLSPDVILFPHNELGEAVAPRLAYRLKTGIITDCVGFDVDEEQLRWLRPVYGGKAMSYMIVEGPVQMATLRSRAFEPLPAEEDREAEVKDLAIDAQALTSPVSIVEKVQEELEGISLDQATTIIAGGRGMREEENFELLVRLADILGAAIGGSRPAADLGWVPHERLIGQTGKIVAPRLYIAVAISGAPQHMAGAGSAKTIVAINNDEDAPIFRQAHLGIVDDWEKVLKPLIEACEEAAE